MKTCKLCQRDFPEELLHPLQTSAGSAVMCPICALTLRNTFAGLPPDTPFDGPKAKALYDEAVKYVEAETIQ